MADQSIGAGGNALPRDAAGITAAV